LDQAKNTAGAPASHDFTKSVGDCHCDGGPNLAVEPQDATGKNALLDEFDAAAGQTAVRFSARITNGFTVGQTSATQSGWTGVQLHFRAF
jgi:hypothetical protein